MKKNIVLAVIATAAMALSLVACGGVTISGVALPESMNLEKGATQQLQLEYSAEGEVATDKIAEAAGKLTVEWSSSDETVVTVDTEGNVTAVSAGEAYVTATVKDKDALTATTMVRVAVTPTGVEAPETLELVTNGENAKNLEAKIVPEDATGVKLAYESSNENVATVDENGMVTAVADGECVITAYVVSDAGDVAVDTEVADSEPVDATSADSGEVADATVADSDATASEPTAESEQVFEPLEQETAESEETADTEVLDPEFATMMEDMKSETKVVVTTKVDSVTLSQNEGILNVGKSVTLTATVTPENAADATVTWSSSDEAVATVDSNGNVTAVATGNATITATAGEESTTCDITVQKAASKPAASSKPATNSTSGNTSTGAAAPSAPAATAPSNPAPAPAPAAPAPAAPAPAAPAPAPAAPAPAPEPSYNPPSDPTQGWEWGGPVLSSPTDNGCTPEEHAAELC